MRTMTLGAGAVSALFAICSIATAQGGCDDTLTQNSTQTLNTGGVACAADGFTTENAYARSFDLGAIFPGSDYQISCVRFGITNGGSDLPATVNIYHDTDGGAPTAPGVDLTLLGSAEYTHATSENIIVNVTFADPVCIQPGTVFVVEIAIPESLDGFATFAGNGDAEDAPTYLRSDSCGLANYVAVGDIGFGDLHWVLEVVGGQGCDPSNTCACDITSNCQIAHPEPGCEDAICEAIVCSQDAFCCEVEWDENCAALSALCGASGFECDFPANNLVENEACGDDTNGGCNSDPAAFEPIAIGDTVLGTYNQSVANDIRDTDWYSFTVAERSIVTWTVNSRVEVDTFIINDQCGDALQIVAVGSGACPSVAEACLDAGDYRAFVAIGIAGDLPCGTAEYDLYTGTLTATPIASCPGADECPDSTVDVTQNSNLEITDGGIACAAGGISTENWYARSYDLSQGETAGSEVSITCIEYGVQNTGGEVPSKVALYLDTDGGAPQAPGIDLELLGERDTVAVAAGFGLQTITFAEPICIPADSVVVATVYFDPSTDGFASFAGNTTAADGPTYIMSESCGLTTFTDLADIGFPDNHFVQIIKGDLGCDSGPTCPADFNNDGSVDGADFGSILAAWGDCVGCPQDLNGDGVVNGADVGLFLSAWGPCL